MCVLVAPELITAIFQIKYLNYFLRIDLVI